MNDAPLVQVRHLCKSYGGVQALRDVSLDISPGEVHAICGENGAGKSTLIKLLAGVISPDEGEIFVQGELLSTGSAARAETAGIAVLYQESTAFGDLSAVDNIFVGRERTICSGLLLERGQMRRQAATLLDQLGEQIDLDAPVRELSLAQRQMVAMARALSHDCRLLIMDEPTASLSARETEVLLQIVRQLRERGISVLYVSHRLEEVFAIADRVTVLRDGAYVATHTVGELDKGQLIRLMVGRDIDELARTKSYGRKTGDQVLQVQNLGRRGLLEDITFDVARHEIVGLAGLLGAGRTEIARAIFGIDDIDSGTVHVAGKQLARQSVAAAISSNVALVPEDRQVAGLVLPMSVGENLTFVVLRTLARGGIISRRRESQLVEQLIREFSIKTAGYDVAANTLSGGNQQKLVLAKWLATRPTVLILDEPTRGIDVGAKSQIHQLIRQLADEGMATLVISSDLPELLALCDRLLIVRNGRIVGELAGATATQADVLSLALPEANDERPTTTSREKWYARLLRQREWGLALLILIITLLAGCVDRGFLSPGNWHDILVRSAPTAVVACGVMLVVVTGEIDISVGSLTALLAACLGVLISRDHWNLSVWLGIPAVLMLGAAVGTATGLLVTVGRVPSIIVTLGLLTALRGLTTWMMGGTNIDGLPTPLTSLAKQGFWGMPLEVWVAAAVTLATALLIWRTPLGTRLYAVGSNRHSAHLAGLSERRLKLFAFAYTGFLTALATVVDVPRLPKIEAGIGGDLELLVVTCVVVGGVAITGGRGRLLGVMLAVVLMTMIRPLLTFLDVGEAGEKWTKAIQGLLILLAVIGDSLLARRDDREPLR